MVLSWSPEKLLPSVLTVKPEQVPPFAASAGLVTEDRIAKPTRRIATTGPTHGREALDLLTKSKVIPLLRASPGAPALVLTQGLYAVEVSTVGATRENGSRGLLFL